MSKIGKYAYASTGIKSITIPKTVLNIYCGTSAFPIFLGCDELTSIIVEEENPVYDSRYNCNSIIETETNSLILGFKSTKIPNDVVSIGPFAFWNVGLTSIKIPNSIMTIGECAFYANSNLSSVYFEQTETPQFGDSCFRIWGETTFYFKNETIYNAFTEDYYNSEYGIKSTNYNW